MLLRSIAAWLPVVLVTVTGLEEGGRADTITGGTYYGSDGIGGNAYATNGTTSLISGGQFFGGTGADSSGSGPGGPGGFGYFSYQDQSISFEGSPSLTGGAGGDGSDGGGGLYVFRASATAISGGSFTGGVGDAGGFGGDGADVDNVSTLTISGGNFTGGGGGAGGYVGSGGYGLVVDDGAFATTVTISAGSFAGAASGGGVGLSLHDPLATGSCTISGGTFVGVEGLEAFFLRQDTEATVSGGSFQTQNASAPDFAVADGSTLTLVGTFDSVGPISDASGTFTGTLADNSAPATYSYDVESEGEILFVSVPEPSGAAMLAVASLSVLQRRRQRRGLEQIGYDDRHRI